MASRVDDSLRLGQQKPLDDKYFNNLQPYADVNQANSLIPESERYIGLTINIDGEEYWYKTGILDISLILKETGITSIPSWQDTLEVNNVVTSPDGNNKVELSVEDNSPSNYFKTIFVAPDGIGDDGASTALSIDTTSILFSYNNESGSSANLELSSSGAIVYGGVGFKGLTYANDYSSAYDNRSLIDKGFLDIQLATKQNTLVSGTNIKTIGGQNIIGAGNITEVQNSLTSSSILAPSVDAVNTGLSTKFNNPSGLLSQYIAGDGTLLTFPSVTGAIWGQITGTLSSQTDLQTALNGKFNNPTGTTLQYLRGDGTTSTFQTDVRATVLTGLSSSTADIVATDTILQAFSKLVPAIRQDSGSIVPVKYIWYGTQTDYDAIGAPSVNTEYNIETDFKYVLKDYVLSKTANYTILTTDYGDNGVLTLYVNATTAPVTITLESIATMTGKTVEVIKTDSTANAVTVQGTGGININAAATYAITSQYSRARIKTNGTQYYLF